MRLPVCHLEENAAVEPLIIVHQGEISSTPKWLKEAREAQGNWAKLAISERLAWVRRVRHALTEEASNIAKLEAQHTDRPVAEILSTQIIPFCDACCFLEREGRKILLPKKVGRNGRPFWLMGHRAEIHREPFGVVLVIAPSNYRLFLPGVMIMQALVAGNAVLLKPGQGGSKVAERLSLIFARAGLDPRLFRILPESPDAAREAISLHVDKIVFTGSAESGRNIIEQAAKQLTPATLELSGCDAVFVREDADLDLVTRALCFGLRLNSGETCIAPRRVFVTQSRAAELYRRLSEALSDLATPYVAQNAEIQSLVQQAVRWGAEYLHGGTRENGEVEFPLVLMKIPPSSRLLKTDLFAPVLSIIEVADDDEAVTVSGECPFALGASIFSRNEPAARHLAQRINVGGVVINDIIVPTADPRLPFGGRKHSGFGVTRGAEGLLEMTVPKVITIRRTRFYPHFEKPGLNEEVIFTEYLTAVHGAGFISRMLGWARLGRLLLQRKQRKDNL